MAIEALANFVLNISSEHIIVFDFAVIIIVSTLFAIVARALKQPLIPAYVVAGLIIGPLVLGLITNIEILKSFSEIGIAFLLFATGIEISFKKIKEAGISKILFVGIVQITLIVLIIILLRNFLFLSLLQATYLGAIIAFSSTMVVVKTLSDRGELSTLHGRLVLGILLLEDLVAVLAIIFFTTGTFSIVAVLIAFLKLGALVVFALFLHYFILNKLFRFAASSPEFLFLTSLSLLFLFVLFSFLTNISVTIGAFIAGVLIANSPFKTELESRINPLRDFFAIVFFVVIGTQIVFSGVSVKLLIIILLSAFILKPVISVVLFRIMGYRQRTSFLTAISLAHISEFSLIIVLIGFSMSVITQGLLSTIILSIIISMSTASYFINYKNGIYNILEKPLRILKFLPIKEDLEYKSSGDKKILLVGAHRIGSIILQKLMKRKQELVVIDYNPEIIIALIKKKISSIYGELKSHETLKKVELKKLKLIISTIPNFEENLYLLEKVKEVNSAAVVILTASRISETKELYEKGADYVIAPKMLAGDELIDLLRTGKKGIAKAKKEHLKRMKNIHNLLY